MTKAPKISVVMPCYNAAPWIRQAVESVYAQTETDWELILVDDGSTDATGELLAALAHGRENVTLLRQKNGGTGAALNAGFALARGVYQTWWSADSWAAPDWLAKLSACLDAQGDVGLAYGDYAIYDERTGVTLPQSLPDYNYDRLQRECYVGVCWLWRAGLKTVAGEFLTGQPCEDYDMHLRLAELAPFQRVPEVLGYWRAHPDNLSTACNGDDWKASRRIVARHKWRKARLKVAHVSPWIDAAGVGWLLAQGLTEIVPGVAVRAIRGDALNVVQQKDDLLCGTDDAEIYDVLRECDLIHCNLVYPDSDLSRFDFRPWLEGFSKPFLMHFHAGPWSWDQRVNERYRQRYGARFATCTPSLRSTVPDAIWMPNLIPLDPTGRMWDAKLYDPPEGWPENRGAEGHSPLRICCHHNYATGKGVDGIRDVLGLLGRLHGFEAEVSLRTENPVPIAEHLREKKRFDVVIDQMTQGFCGMAAWESLAQGAVVIARLDAAAVREYTALGEGEPPPICNVQSVDELAVLLLDLSRADAGRIRALKQAGRAWMLRYYNAERIAARWVDLYRSVLQKG